MYEIATLNLDELILDVDNPRINTADSQANAIKKIIELSPTQFKKLIVSIRDDGLDPGDRLYVMKSNSESDYVVLEGNRRVAALKILDNPDLLKGTGLPENLINSILKICTLVEFEVQTSFRCVLFENRESAKKWIHRRHAGELHGEGRIPWNPLDIQRFNRNYQIIDVLDFIGESVSREEPEWENIRKTIEKKKSSTLERLLNSSTGIEHLGISTKETNGEKIPTLSRDAKWTSEVLKKIVFDIHDGIIDSRNLNDKEAIKRYFNQLPKELQPVGKKGKSEPIRNITQTLIQSKGKKTSKQIIKKVTKKAPKQQVTLAPKEHTFNPPKSEKGCQLLREASNVRIKTFPLSSAFILRAFIEMTIHEFIKINPGMKMTKNTSKARPTINSLFNNVINHCESNELISKNEIRNIKNHFFQKHSLTSFQALNEYIHGKYPTPSADLLISCWSVCIPLFELTFGVVSDE